MNALVIRASSALPPPAAQLQFAHLIFQIRDILAAISDISVNTLQNKRVRGRVPHVLSGGDEGLFALDLVGHLGHEIVVAFHDGMIWRGNGRVSV